MRPKALLRSALTSAIARRDTVSIIKSVKVEGIKLRDKKKRAGRQFLVQNKRDRKPKHVCLILHKDPEKTVKDKLMNSDILVYCDCGFHTYYCEYALTKHGASWIESSNGQPPVDKNPKLRAWTCYHVTSLLATIVQKKI